MSSSNIIVRTKYQSCKDLRHGVSKTISYIGDKKKADSSSINEYDILKDYTAFANNDSYLYEDSESFTWSMNGDIDAKKDLKEIKNLDSKGYLWSLVISFPPEFAINKGLITKLDYYNLTKNIMPQFLTNMGFKLDNVSWYCALHRNTDNPHLHINFFEHKRTISNPIVPYSAIHKLKSDVANYLIDNKKFYELRDQEFTSITGEVSLEELTKIKNQKLFSDKYRRDLNKMLLNFYDKLSPKGRLQYNSKNILKHRDELDKIINYILMHDSIKYKYAKYLRLLEEHQKELEAVYGNSKSNQNLDYYNNQLNRLYSKIGNEILSNYKIYSSADFMDREKEFIKKHYHEFKFKSRDYKKEESINDIAKGLYIICNLGGLNYHQTKQVFTSWINRSHYNYKADDILSSMLIKDTTISKDEYFKILSKLGYDYDRLSKFKSKRFYQALNYKKFINSAVNHLMYELEKEEKQIISNIEYDLEM